MRQTPVVAWLQGWRMRIQWSPSGTVLSQAPIPPPGSARAVSRCPQETGTAAGDAEPAGTSAGALRAARLLSAGRSLHLVAEPRTTNGRRDKSGGARSRVLAPGLRRDPAAKIIECHPLFELFISITLDLFCACVISAVRSFQG